MFGEFSLISLALKFVARPRYETDDFCVVTVAW